MEILHLDEKIVKQQQLLNALPKRVDYLVGNVIRLESELVISHTVTDLLEQKLNNLEAYSKRPCAILLDIKKPNKRQ